MDNSTKKLLFQFAAQFLKLLLQCMDLRDIGTLVQIGKVGR